MKVLENQTLYQCDYCGKRLLTKNGAKIHEEEYCKSSAQLIDKGFEILINCQHDWKTQWTPIPGEEHLSEPSHDVCIKCGAEDYLVNDFKGIKAKEDISERMLSRIATLDRDKRRYGIDLMW
ncbi:DNA-directed RNA polymerase subunit RPC12/RpoP [Lysinibacillus parviboronicapiens]|uniref:DNA-directed RNA polymerase subunit RPC12/RpoP n=1 Tax=Lysinibacillus parviboronicapiens TaxID=436516 RepID=A0ABV2PMN4_9BACI